VYISNNLRSTFALNQTPLGDDLDSLDFATNARDQAAIVDGRMHGTSVLQAFDEAWHKASEFNSEHAND
jgi:hypothetical protein